MHPAWGNRTGVPSAVPFDCDLIRQVSDTLSAAEQKTAVMLVAGTTTSGAHKKHKWEAAYAPTTCVLCGNDDTCHHRLFECPALQDICERYPSKSSTGVHSPAHPGVAVLRVAFCGRELPEISAAPYVPANKWLFFTDGSCNRPYLAIC